MWPESLSTRCSNEGVGEMEMRLVLVSCLYIMAIPPPWLSVHSLLIYEYPFGVVIDNPVAVAMFQ